MRKLFFWFHLCLGLAAGIIVLEKCVTGILLTYEKQINTWARHQTVRFTPPAEAAARLTPEALMAKVREQAGIEPYEITFYSNPAEPVGVLSESMSDDEGNLYVNPYTGASLGRTTIPTRAFFRSVNHLHRWAGIDGGLRKATESTMNAANVAFFFILLSGIYLWIPRKMTWQHFKPVVLFRKGASGKARDFNWHNVIGVWAWLPLVVIVGSAVEMSYDGVKDFVYSSTASPVRARDGKKGKKKGGEKGPQQNAGKKGGAQQGDRPQGTQQAANGRQPEPAVARRRHDAPPLNYAGLDAAVATAEAQMPGWNYVRVRVPDGPRDPFEFTVDKGNGAQPQDQGALTVAREDGRVVKWTPFEAQSSGRRIESILRYTHTGEIWGVFGETLALLFTAGGCVLVYTGIALSLRRFLNWKKRRSRPAPVAKAGKKQEEKVLQAV